MSIDPIILSIKSWGIQFLSKKDTMLSNRKNYRNIFYVIFLLIFTFSVVWLCQPIGSAVLWLSGSCNYLWTATFSLFFMYPFCKYYLKDDNTGNQLKNTFYIPLLGLLSGWSNEVLSISIFSFIILFFSILKFEKRKIPSWAVAGFIGAFIGLLLLFLAPGNYLRLNAETMIHHANSEGAPFIIKLLRNAYLIVYTIFFSGEKVLIIPMYAIVYLFYKYHKTGTPRVLRLSLIFMTAAIFGVSFMCVSPIFRIEFGSVHLLL